MMNALQNVFPSHLLDHNLYDFENLESKVSEVENAEIEIQQMKANLKATTGIDSEVGWKESFLNQFDSSLAKARLNTKTNITTSIFII